MLTHSAASCYKSLEHMRSSFRHIILCTFLVAVWIATPLLSAVHIAFEAHTFCAEHGVLEEGNTSHGKRLADDKQNSGANVLPGKPGEPDNHSHVICAFGELATHDITPHSVEIWVETAPTATLVDLLSFKRSINTTDRLFQTAPKTSPPLAA